MSINLEVTRVKPVSILDFGSYLPGDPVGLDFFQDTDGPGDPLANSPLFRAPTNRHHVGPDERAAEMIVKAARPMFDRLGISASGNVDILITNVLLPDHLFTGSGAEAAHLLGCTPDWIIDLHNGGCASFAYMVKLAQTIIHSGAARTALLCNVQNSAGQVFAQSAIRTLPHASVPGDGCGVAYLAAGDQSPVLGVEVVNAPEYAMDVGVAVAERKYWEPGEAQIDVRFNEQRLTQIVERGNQIVPAAVRDLCERIGVRPSEIDVLVTNQPNRIYLRNWCEALDLEPRQHLDTFDRFGNLYGAGVPVTVDHALRDGRIRDGDLVVLAGFAHAGDFASAAALRWHTS